MGKLGSSLDQVLENLSAIKSSVLKLLVLLVVGLNSFALVGQGDYIVAGLHQLVVDLGSELLDGKLVDSSRVS